VVGGGGSYNSGEVRGVMDVEYGCVIVEGVREKIILTCVSYGVSPDGAADTRFLCCM
jgi:hypothetical protein